MSLNSFHIVLTVKEFNKYVFTVTKLQYSSDFAAGDFDVICRLKFPWSLLFVASLSVGYITILKHTSTTNLSGELAEQQTVLFEKLEAPCRELKILPTFPTTEGTGSKFQQPVGYIFIPRHFATRIAR
jgi:hypothetical protein